MNLPLELIVASFDGDKRAPEVLKALQAKKPEQKIELVIGAILSKSPQGKFKIFETDDVNPRQGAVFGAVVGGLVGLLGGPAGAVVGAAAGAAVGGAAAGQIDMGFKNESLQSFESALPADSSALILLVENRWADTLQGTLQSYSDDLFRQALTDETSREIWGQLAKKTGSTSEDTLDKKVD